MNTQKEYYKVEVWDPLHTQYVCLTTTRSYDMAIHMGRKPYNQRTKCRVVKVSHDIVWTNRDKK